MSGFMGSKAGMLLNPVPGPWNDFFGSGKATPLPEAAPLPVQPTTDDALQAEQDIARLRKRRGRASTFLTGAFGKPSAAAGMLGTAPGSAAEPAGNVYGGGGSASPTRAQRV